MITLTVSKATSSKNGGFVVTLNEVLPSETMVTPFGTTNRSQFGRAFYMKVVDAPKVGLKADLDLTDFNVVPREFTTEEGKQITCDWLYAK